MDREEVRRTYETLDEEEKEIIKRRLEDESLLSISMKTHRGYSTVNKINGRVLAAFGVKRWGEIKDDLEAVVDKPIEEAVEQKKTRSCQWSISITFLFTGLAMLILGLMSFNEDILGVQSFSWGIIMGGLILSIGITLIVMKGRD